MASNCPLFSDIPYSEVILVYIWAEQSILYRDYSSCPLFRGSWFHSAGMLAQDFGHIVNISSVCGVSGMPLRSTYCASKFALQGLTHTLRYEVLVV